VKILFNKKDAALIQMEEAGQAQLARTHLDRLKLFGRNICVTLSKYDLVQLPKDGQPGAELTKDYLNSNLHRFRNHDSKNYSNIFPPSEKLHLWNIPISYSDEEIINIFQNSGNTENGGRGSSRGIKVEQTRSGFCVKSCKFLL